MFLFYLPGLFLRIPKYELIHIFSASYWSYSFWSLPPLLIGKLFGKIVILNYRSGEAQDHLSGWRTAVSSIRLADYIVAPGQYLVDVFAKFGLCVTSIPNILDPADLIYRRRSKLRPLFLSNRGLEPIYNVECILRAFAIVQKQYPSAQLTVAHDGSCRAKLIALTTQLGLQNVSFIGRVEQHDMADLYDSIDVYLTSPNFDCMPNSLLECFAAGVPFVATKAGGIPYIVRHDETGLLVECNDHEAMAACCLQLLNDKNLVERLTTQAYLELQKYSARFVSDRWVEIYKKAAERSVKNH